MKPALFALLAACGDEIDPCADIPGTCIAVRVTADDIDEIDQLELDILYDDRHSTLATAPSGGTAALPVVMAIELDATTTTRVGVVAAGKLGGNVLGTGAANVEVAPATRVALSIVLAAPVECVPGGLYCGGDKVAGDAQTLYECNGGGVPIARGVCAGGCIVDPAADDKCRGVGGTCVETGFYCGGDKLDGDPKSLYVCDNGVGVNRMECPNRCVVAPPMTDDYCE